MAALSDAELARITQQLNANPAIAPAIEANRLNYGNIQGMRGSHPLKPGEVAYKPTPQIYKQFGIDFPDANDYKVVQDPQTGQYSLQRDNFFQRNADWLLPVSVIGGGAAGVIASGAGAAPGAVPAATSSAPTAAAVGGPAAAGVTPAIVDAASSNAAGYEPGADVPSGSGGGGGGGTGGGGGGTGGGGTTEEILRRLLSGNSQNQGIDWTSLALGGIGSALNAWAATQAGPQKRQSFRGTTADPVDILSGATKAIGSEAHTLNDLQSQPPELTGPGPQSLPTFTGGGLPMPIGVRRNLTPPLGTHPLSSQPATSDELDHLYSSLSMLGGKR
jgi:hypothetical protein